MKLVKATASASKYDRNPHSMSESGFIIHATSRSIIARSEVGDKKARSPNFRNYLVVNPVVVILAIDPQRLVSRINNAWSYALRIGVRH